MLKKYFTRSLRSLVKYFSILEEKFRISARPSNILYVSTKGRQSPSSRGSGGMLSQNILEFQSLRMRMPVFRGLSREDESMFFIQENIAFIQVLQLQNQFLQAMNKCQYSKFRTLNLYINKFCVNLQRNMEKVD